MAVRFYLLKLLVNYSLVLISPVRIMGITILTYIPQVHKNMGGSNMVPYMKVFLKGRQPDTSV